MPEADAAPALACLNCGAPLGGPYCAQCGQRHRDGEDRTIRSLALEAFNALTSFDSRMWRTFVALLLRPGRLTLDHVEGRRASYLGPVTVFLLASVVFYLLAPMQANFYSDAGVSSRVAFMEDDPSAPDWVEARVRGTGKTRAEFAAEYDRRAPEIKKALTILFAPAIALPLALLFRRRRPLFADHVVFAFHLSATMMVLTGLLAGLAGALTSARPESLGALAPHFETVFKLLLSGSLGLTFVWLAAALRRVYALRWPHAAPAAVLVGLLLLVATFLFGDLRNVIAIWWLS
ncbi:MAG TPA: DUF3667 domain-containing protein [Xanthomonadales bacterium]|nr:DUF3667 domain-containing protein [Xanthomonadales bacterium]